MEKKCENKWDLVVKYLPIIEKMAKSYHNRLIGYDDLYQEACLTVYESISDYDESRGMSISSFLTDRIRYRFFDLLASNKFEAFVPLSYCRKAYSLHRLQQKTYLSSGKYLSVQEAAVILKYSEVTVKALENLNLNGTRFKGNNSDLICENDIFDEEEYFNYDVELWQKKYAQYLTSDINVEEGAISQVLVEEILNQVNGLSDKRKQSILFHLGFVTGNEETFASVAEAFGGTRQNAQQHYDLGIKVLRKSFLEE